MYCMRLGWTENAVLVTALQVRHQRLLVEETLVAEAARLHVTDFLHLLCAGPHGNRDSGPQFPRAGASRIPTIDTPFRPYASCVT